jgi:hypothetical protein
MIVGARANAPAAPAAVFKNRRRLTDFNFFFIAMGSSGADNQRSTIRSASLEHAAARIPSKGGGEVEGGVLNH